PRTLRPPRVSQETGHANGRQVATVRRRWPLSPNWPPALAPSRPGNAQLLPKPGLEQRRFPLQSKRGVVVGRLFLPAALRPGPPPRGAVAAASRLWFCPARAPASSPRPRTTTATFPPEGFTCSVQSPSTKLWTSSSSSAIGRSSADT